MPIDQPENTDRLLAALRKVDDHVLDLTITVNIARKQAVWNRAFSAVLAVVMVLVSTFGYLAWQHANDAIEQNEANAVQACENANDSRAANLALWQYVLQISSENPDNTPAQEVRIAKIRAWVVLLYRPHNCDDLGADYPIPDPPDLSS